MINQNFRKVIERDYGSTISRIVEHNIANHRRLQDTEGVVDCIVRKFEPIKASFGGDETPVINITPGFRSGELRISK